MRRILYTQIASVQIRHSFYKDNISPDFTLIPTRTTADLLRSFDWVLRHDDSAFLVMGREDEPGIPSTPIDSPVLLTFVLTLTNPLLPNVSNWGAKGPFYFTNLDLANGKPKPNDADGSILLTTGPAVAETDLLPPVKRQRLSLPVEKGVFKSLVVSQFMAGAGFKTVQQQPIDKNLESLKIILPNPGRYTLTWEKVDGTAPVVEPIFVNDEIANLPLFFGLLNLYFDATPAPPVSFVVPMKHRERVWRYVLIDSKSKLGPPGVDTANDLSITYQNPGPPFPATVTFAPINPPSAEDSELIETIKKDERVKAVYLLQSTEALPVLNYLAPKLRLTYPEGSSPLPVPTPEIPNSTLFFTI